MKKKLYESDVDPEFNAIIDLFDKVLASDDPRIKDLLKQLMTMTILLDAGADKKVKGPLKRMFDKIQSLEYQVNKLYHELHTTPRKSMQDYKEEKIWENREADKADTYQRMLDLLNKRSGL